MSDQKAGDDLTRIKGVGPKLAQSLIKNGVTTFVQIAALDGAAIAVLENTGDFKGNNDWPAWIAEAKMLSDFAKDETLSGAKSSQVIVVDDPATKTFDVSFPPPEGMPPRMLEGAQLVVKSKAERGFRRAGHAFTPAETLIALSDLSEAQQRAIANEAELIVKLRLVQAD